MDPSTPLIHRGRENYSSPPAKPRLFRLLPYCTQLTVALLHEVGAASRTRAANPDRSISLIHGTIRGPIDLVLDDILATSRIRTSTVQKTLQPPRRSPHWSRSNDKIVTAPEPFPHTTACRLRSTFSLPPPQPQHS